MQGYARAVADGLRQLRPARRERRHQEPDVIRGRSPTPASRSCKAQHPPPRCGLRLAPRGPQPRPATTCTGTSGSSCASSRRGLAYRRNAPVNWCPGCQTVLANEQVLADGTCERSGDVVVKRDLEQWFFKHHRLRRRAARRPRRPRLARAGQDHAAQLDRPLRGREFELAVAESATAWASIGSSPPGPTPVSA